MRSNKNIAVIGAGIAGLTISFLLKEQGHNVTLFEQAEECKPVGAGFILQPSGQNVLKKLNLLSEIEAKSHKLSGIKAKLRNGKKLVDIKYNKISSELYGLGVKRSIIFNSLLDRCKKNNVEILENSRINSIDQGEKVTVHYNNNSAKFDLLIAADGSRSTIRKVIFNNTKISEYQYAALWTLAKCSNLPNHLLQIVEDTKRLTGILPVDNKTCSFFWGIHVNEKERIWEQGIEKWKKDVIDFSPELTEIVNSIESLEQLTFSSYRSCMPNRLFKNNIVLIGDAAHSSSPHLGQGVNLALEDCLALAESFQESDKIEMIFKSYEYKRMSISRYYTQLTAILTPFFQSDHNALALPRNVALRIMPELPIIGSEMARSMSGLKRSWLDIKIY